ncbi:hypothetical protein BGX14_0226 [Fibrobacter sp. UWS1]|nr:hypothetical protein BGX14_0226 [Fibrobacter sp. UWS1]
MAICAGFPSLRAKRSNLVSRKGLLHPFGVRNDEYHQSPRRVQAPLVLARRDSTVAILAGPPSLRGALAPWQSCQQERIASPLRVRNDEYHQSPRRVQAPLVLARNVKDIAIHTDSSSLRGAKQRSNLGWLPVLARRDSTVAILAGPPSLRGAIAPWQSVRVSRHCEQSEAILSAGKDCFTPSGFAMTNTTSRPEECKHHSSLRGASKT